MRENVNSKNWDGTSWMTIALPQVNGQDMQMKQISAGLDGFATGVGMDGQVYQRLGCTKEMPEGNAW